MSGKTPESTASSTLNINRPEELIQGGAVPDWAEEKLPCFEKDMHRRLPQRCLLALMQYADAHSRAAAVSAKDIASTYYGNCSERQVRRQLKQLADRGLVEKEDLLAEHSGESRWCFWIATEREFGSAFQQDKPEIITEPQSADRDNRLRIQTGFPTPTLPAGPSDAGPAAEQHISTGSKVSGVGVINTLLFAVLNTPETVATAPERGAALWLVLSVGLALLFVGSLVRLRDTVESRWVTRS